MKAERKIKSLEKEGFKHHSSKKELTGQGYSNDLSNPLHTHTHTYKHPDGRVVKHEHIESMGNTDIHTVREHSKK